MQSFLIGYTIKKENSSRMSNTIKANDIKLEKLSLDVLEDFEQIEKPVLEDRIYGGKR
jgi:hypothetical protein